jgi:hypothetical protein
MLAAMALQFKPSIREALDAAEVTTLCEAEACDTSNDLTMLAVLHAWLGHRAVALDLCLRIQNCPLPTLAPVTECEAAMRLFGRTLATEVDAGSEREFLDRSASDFRSADAAG